MGGGVVKKFSFSLQKLLSYKEQLFDTELTVLGDMRAALTRMQQELEDLYGEHKTRSLDFREKLARGTTAQDIGLHKMYLRIVENSIEQKLAQIALQQQAIEKQVDKVREAKLEISTMEKLREHKLEEYNYLDNKAAEQFIEEFVSYGRAAARGV